VNRGPKVSRVAIDPVEKAAACWGETMPDWVLVLAEACQKSNQSAVARQLDYSAGVVSSVLSNTYRGDVSSVEQMVRGALMSETVHCPIIGPTPRNVCLGWQKRPFSTASSNAVRMYQACRQCPNARIPQRGDDNAV
jgi:uncharacterized protein involved in cysteine biosynthesis